MHEIGSKCRACQSIIGDAQGGRLACTRLLAVWRGGLLYLMTTSGGQMAWRKAGLMSKI